VGGPNTRPANPKWQTAAILKTAVKSPYLCNPLTDFDEIWHGDAHLSPETDVPVKVKFKLQQSYMSDSRNLRIEKLLNYIL